MLRPAQGGWQRVDIANGEVTVPSRGDRVVGTFSYQPPPNSRGLMVRVSIGEAGNPQCRVAGSSEEMEPCDDGDD
jgi:hypothetical protein